MKSVTDVGWGGLGCSRHSSSSWRCLVRLMSGVCVGHSSTSASMPSRALSCWNKFGPFSSKRRGNLYATEYTHPVQVYSVWIVCFQISKHFKERPHVGVPSNFVVLCNTFWYLCHQSSRDHQPLCCSYATASCWNLLLLLIFPVTLWLGKLLHHLTIKSVPKGAKHNILLIKMSGIVCTWHKNCSFDI